MGRYTSGGKINTTTAVGNVRVPLTTADGGVHIVIDDAVNKGLYHPCGAIRVNSGTGTTYYDGTGAVYSNRLFGPGK